MIIKSHWLFMLKTDISSGKSRFSVAEPWLISAAPVVSVAQGLDVFSSLPCHNSSEVHWDYWRPHHPWFPLRIKKLTKTYKLATCQIFPSTPHWQQIPLWKVPHYLLLGLVLIQNYCFWWTFNWQSRGGAKPLGVAETLARFNMNIWHSNIDYMYDRKYRNAM